MRVIGFAGWSGSGKTSVIRRVIPALIAQGISVSTVKHAHRGFEIDIPGKDSYLHRQAGAGEVIVASSDCFALIHQFHDQQEIELGSLLSRLAPVDLVIIEGFKKSGHPQIEVHRPELGKPLLYSETDNIIGIVSTGALPSVSVPTLLPEDTPAIVDIVLRGAVAVESLRL
jgi:molybdopterin-guanine dinucleotide biosynthesis protein B